MGASLQEVMGSKPGWFNALLLAASLILLAAPLRAEFAYIANNSEGTISGYVIGSNGTLTPVPGSPFATGGSVAGAVIVDPTGRFAYAVIASAVSVFSIESNGALTPVSGSPFAISGSGLTMDPAGRFVYAISSLNTMSVYSIGSGGALTQVGSPITAGSFLQSITIDPKGRFAYVLDAGNTPSTVLAFSIGANGALTPVAGSSVTTGNGPSPVVVDPKGLFAYVSNYFDFSVSAFSIGANGALTPIPGSPFAGGAYGMTIDPTDSYAYVAGNGNQVNVLSIGANGALTKLESVAAGWYPLTVTVDQSGRFAYVTNQGQTDPAGVSNIWCYSIGSDGNLTFIATVNAPGGPYPVYGNNNSVAITPLLAPFVYAVDDGNNTLSAFSTDSTGALTPVPGSPVATGNSPYSVNVDPSGRFAYVANSFDNTVSAYSIGSNGTLAPVPGSPFATGVQPQSVIVDPSGRFAYVANTVGSTVSAYTIGSNGALTPVSGSPFATGYGPYFVTVDPSGRFVYTTNFGDNTISAFSIGSNGALTPVSGSPFAAGNSPISVTVDPSGRFVYVANENDSSVSAYTIGPSGNLVPFTGLQFAPETWPRSVTVDPTDSFLYVGNGGSSMVYSIGVTGALTLVSASSFTPTLSVATTPLIPFALSTTAFETEAGTPATFTLSDSFTLGKNSTGIDPVTERVILRIGTFAVTIPVGKFTRLADGTFNFNGTINKVAYKVTIAPLGNNSFKLTAKGTGLDLTKLGKQVPVLLAIGFNGGNGTAPHKQ